MARILTQPTKTEQPLNEVFRDCSVLEKRGYKLAFIENLQANRGYQISNSTKIRIR